MPLKLPPQLRKHPEKVVQMYHLDVKCRLKFRGEDARAARRYLYDNMRKYPPIFANFDGPRDPIEMTFCSASGEGAREAIELFLSRHPFEDVEMRLDYKCYSDPGHHGTCKFGRRKKGFWDFGSQKMTQEGQIKIT